MVVASCLCLVIITCLHQSLASTFCLAVIFSIITFRVSSPFCHFLSFFSFAIIILSNTYIYTWCIHILHSIPRINTVYLPSQSVLAYCPDRPQICLCTVYPTKFDSTPHQLLNSLSCLHCHTHLLCWLHS